MEKRGPKKAADRGAPASSGAWGSPPARVQARIDASLWGRVPTDILHHMVGFFNSPGELAALCSALGLRVCEGLSGLGAWLPLRVVNKALWLALEEPAVASPVRKVLLSLVEARGMDLLQADGGYRSAVALDCAARWGEVALLERLLHLATTRGLMGGRCCVVHEGSLMRAAAGAGQVEVVWRLLARGGEFSEMWSVRYGVQEAAREGHVPVLRLLLGAAARQGCLGGAVLEVASCGPVEVMRWLLHEGAAGLGEEGKAVQRELREGGALQREALEEAAANDNVEVVRFLVKKCGASAQAALRATTHWARCGGGEMRVLNYLLGLRGLDPAAHDSAALRDAARSGSVNAVVRLLQDSRVDPNARDGEALIHAAAAPGFTHRGRGAKARMLLALVRCQWVDLDVRGGQLLVELAAGADEEGVVEVAEEVLAGRRFYLHRYQHGWPPQIGSPYNGDTPRAVRMAQLLLEHGVGRPSQLDVSRAMMQGKRAVAELLSLALLSA